MQRERQAEAARLRRELLVREKDPKTRARFRGFVRDARATSRAPSRSSFDASSPDRFLPPLQTSLSEAREEIRKLKIQVDAQASLLRLQRALDASPATRAPRRDAAAAADFSPAASATRREKKPPSPVGGVSNALDRSCAAARARSAETRSEERETATTSRDARASHQPREEVSNARATPPPPRRPRANLRSFAARETTSPPTRDEENDEKRENPPRVEPNLPHPPPPSATLRRALRHRLKHVVYAEPSLKTKMRRPRTPPPAARAAAAAAVGANPFLSRSPRERNAVSAETRPVDDHADAEDENVSDDSAASQEEASTTPVAFVTSRRHRRRRAVAHANDP